MESGAEETLSRALKRRTRAAGKGKGLPVIELYVD